MSASETAPRFGRLGAFAFRDYRWLWLLTLVTQVVLWLRIFGTGQWLLDDTGSATVVGLIGLVQLLVQVPMLLVAGTLADRVDRKRLLRAADSANAIALLGLAWLSAQDALTPTLVFVGIALSAGAQTLANPARSALVPIIVPREKQLLAASTDTAGFNIAAVIGPLLFALIATGASLTWVFATGGVLAALASLLPLLIRAPGRAVADDEAAPRPSALAQTAAGFRYVAGHPILPGLYLLDAGITVATFYREILPVLALGLFAGGASATGALGAANSAGAIVGALIAMAFVAWRAKGMLVLYASLIYGALMVAFSLASSLWLGLLLIAALGAADSVTVAVRQATVMLTTPDHMRGRAFALMVLAAQSANNIGTIWVGALAGAIGASQSMLVGGIFSIVATLLIGWLWRPIRTFRSD
ncbi:MAG: MFS transporter [Pseudomonadota bacterium]